MLDNITTQIKNTTKFYKPQARWEKRGVIKRGLPAAKKGVVIVTQVAIGHRAAG